MKIAAVFAVCLACLIPIPGAQAGEKELAVLGEQVLQVAVILADLANGIMQPAAQAVDWMVDNLGDAILWLIKFVAGLAKFAGEQTADAAAGGRVEKNILDIAEGVKTEGFKLAKDGAALVRKFGDALYAEAIKWATSKGVSKLPGHFDLSSIKITVLPAAKTVD